MKIKIKSMREIEATLNKRHCKGYSDMTGDKNEIYFARHNMGIHCGAVIDGDFSNWSSTIRAEEWHWHPDWYEIVFEKDDLEIIAELDEMLDLVLRNRGGQQTLSGTNNKGRL